MNTNSNIATISFIECDKTIGEHNNIDEEIKEEVFDEDLNYGQIKTEDIEEDIKLEEIEDPLLLFTEI